MFTGQTSGGDVAGNSWTGGAGVGGTFTGCQGRGSLGVENSTRPVVEKRGGSDGGGQRGAGRGRNFHLGLLGSGGGGHALGGGKESLIRALFFDVGGTLLQPAEPIGATYANLAVAYGWKAESEAVQRGFRAAWKKRREEGVGSDKTLGKKGWARIVEESLKQAEMPENFPFEVYFEEVFAYFARPEAWRDFSETGEVIEGIVKKGLRVGVLSNWDPRLRCVLAGFAWAKLLDPILLSEECGVEKPAPACKNSSCTIDYELNHHCHRETSLTLVDTLSLFVPIVFYCIDLMSQHLLCIWEGLLF